MKRSVASIFTALALVPLLFLLMVPAASAGPASIPPAQAPNPDPPAQTVKLIFIHHSTGENWLRDDYGGLGQALADNNYFVSDTNYGWGPDAIGDRTDIPNWEEWFASDQTPTYMRAVYNESGQNSSYTRLSDDPGGENTIIMFKSCFPNSALEGNPNDPPSSDGWLTVGHAKYVYNQILSYFASRPDKLFIVITAPPLQDGTYAKNARAFNNWLLEDWLDQNNYNLKNVAVFDFYNVLTAKEAHHWYQDGEIQHIVQNKNTLAYPSGDDHPNPRGSQKATDEFIPLLNIFYNRWIGSGTANRPAATANVVVPTEAEAPSESGGSGVPLPPEVVLSIDDFESGAGWQADWDASTASTITCYADQGTGVDGTAALLIDFQVTSGSWANCAVWFDTPQDWSQGDFLDYYVHGSAIGLPFSIAVYGGTNDAMETYVKYGETPVNTGDYIEFTTAWSELLRADWEENGGTPFEDTSHVLGITFTVDGQPETLYAGQILIDNLTLQKYPDTGESGGDEGAEEESSPLSGLPCIGGALLPILLVGFTFIIRRR